MKEDLHRVIELFRKSFTSSLTGEEGEELKEILDENSLKKAYEQLSDKTFLVEKFREFDEYEYKPAFNKLKSFHRQRINRRLIVWASSVAAVIILAFVLVYKGEQNIEPIKEQVAMQHIIPPGSKTAMLKLADGRMIKIGEQPLEIEEGKGNIVKYEEGSLSYSSDIHSGEEVYNELEVPIGGECHLHLDDGTEVWLNADSKLKYPVSFKGEQREVVLAGEAYFDVKKESRPFIVSMEEGDVTVLGTSFGVSAYKGQTSYTTLVCGRVRYTSKQNKSVVLEPGEQAVMSSSGVLEKRNVNIEEFVGWKDGIFVFRNKTLGTIMEILERWYGVKIVFRDECLRDLEYTGNLERYDSINVFLELLERLKDIRYKIEEDTIVLFK